MPQVTASTVSVKNMQFSLSVHFSAYSSTLAHLQHLQPTSKVISTQGSNLSGTAQDQ